MRDSPDKLSSLLTGASCSAFEQLELEAAVAGAFAARGDFSVEIGAYTGLLLHMIVKGEFWLQIEGETQALHMSAGDCVLLTNGRSATVSSRRDVKATVHRQTLAAKAVDGVMILDGGGDFFGIGLHLVFGGPIPKVLFNHLPPSIHIPSHSEQSMGLRWAVERFRIEYMEQGLGRRVVLGHIAPIILLQCFRSHVASGAAMSDRHLQLTNVKVAKAIEQMQGDMRRDWTVASLAGVANMSRSGFATNFRLQVGLTPLEYLTRWRIHTACALLTSGKYGVAEIADLVGYRSESAFSTVFKKLMNCRPGTYARKNQSLHGQ